MYFNDITVEQLCSKPEGQTFERKSAKKDPKSFSNHIAAFANADGGLLVVGIEDDSTVTGIDDYPNHINELLRVPFDFCKPSIRVSTRTLDCIDMTGRQNHILVMQIPQSPEVHANQQDEVYYRMGDKSQKMNFDERLQLLYAKGTLYYEDEPVFGSSIDDLDMEFITSYCQKIGYARSPEEYIRQNKDFVITHYGREELSGAAVLLFGKHPQRFFQRARIRFIRYEGVTAEVGTHMNVIKDVIFEGKILDMVRDSLEFVRSQIKEYTRLGDDCRFFTTPEYPEFAWKETIINAIAHRDYSIKGTDIQIKMFDDRITVESPGILPGLVRLNNIRTVHFSRNPKIAAFLHEYDYVQEFGEGVDRMFREMRSAGLPDPEHKTVSFMLHATIRNQDRKTSAIGHDGGLNDGLNDTIGGLNDGLTQHEFNVYQFIKSTPTATASVISDSLSISLRSVERIIQKLKEKNMIQRVGSKKTGHWKVL